MSWWRASCGYRCLAFHLVLSALSSVNLATTAAASGSSSSYEAGYMTVDEEGSQLFYWYTPALNGNESAPLVLWLQGGPGASGLVGLFHELGPYTLEPDTTQEGGGGWQVGSREVTWAREMGLIFVDSPVGTGFSRTKSEAGYANNEDDVARDLWAFMQGFFTKYPQLAGNDFYVFGESYGGHYAPHFAAYIWDQNQRLQQQKQQQQGLVVEEVPIRLAGVGVGDGLTDPAVQVLTKPAAAYGFGLIDGKQLLEAQRLAMQASTLARRGAWVEAKQARVQLEDLITSSSGVDLMDVRLFLTDAPDLDGPIAQWANTPQAREALNLPNDAEWGTDKQVMAHLESDIMVSYASDVSRLLDEARVPVLLYQGQFDLKDGVVANQAWIQADLRWSGRSGWLAANRTAWCLDDDDGSRPAGWVQEYGLLSQVVVQGAGHLLPMAQPERALDMVTRFVHRRPFSSSSSSPSLTTDHHSVGGAARLRGAAAVASVA